MNGLRILTLLFSTLTILVQSLPAVSKPKDYTQATNYLYRVDLLRAKPGSLESLITAIKNQQGDLTMPSHLLRHSQGDQWDLMLIIFVDSYDRLHSGNRYKKIQALYQLLNPQLSFQESTYMKGPQPIRVSKQFEGNNLYHIEMFVALPDKRDALIKERNMESQYLINIDRAPNLLFVKEQGANWDAMTIGFYPSLKAFATMADIPFAEDNQAAIDAGFEGVGKIGFYLRSLLQSHNDTLAVRP